MPPEKPGKIAMKEIIKHPFRWIAVHPGDYADLRYNGTAEEKVAAFDEMVDMTIKLIEPKFPQNIIVLARSHAMWNEKVNRNKEFAKKKREDVKEIKEENKKLRAITGQSEPPNLFNAPTGERPTREEVLRFAESIGAICANAWYDWTINNNWCDGSNQPIRNWKAAFRSYEKTHNPDFNPPETAQQQEDAQ